MTDDLFTILRQDMKDGFAQVCDRLDQQNGRVRKAEQDIAVLQERGNRASVVWGSGAAATVVGVIETIRAYFK